MQPHDPNYKPKTTIIPANPGLTASHPEDGEKIVVVAWVIEDGRIARAICYDPRTKVPCELQRGADE